MCLVSHSLGGWYGSLLISFWFLTKEVCPGVAAELVCLWGVGKGRFPTDHFAGVTLYLSTPLATPSSLPPTVNWDPSPLSVHPTLIDTMIAAHKSYCELPGNRDNTFSISSSILGTEYMLISWAVSLKYNFQRQSGGLFVLTNDEEKGVLDLKISDPILAYCQLVIRPWGIKFAYFSLIFLTSKVGLIQSTLWGRSPKIKGMKGAMGMWRIIIIFPYWRFCPCEGLEVIHHLCRLKKRKELWEKITPLSSSFLYLGTYMYDFRVLEIQEQSN